MHAPFRRSKSTRAEINVNILEVYLHPFKLTRDGTFINSI